MVSVNSAGLKGKVPYAEEMFENVDGRTTDGRTTDARVIGTCILKAHLGAFGSGDLIT